MVSALGDDAVVLGALAIALARAREKVFARAMLLSARDSKKSRRLTSSLRKTPVRWDGVEAVAIVARRDRTADRLRLS